MIYNLELKNTVDNIGFDKEIKVLKEIKWMVYLLYTADSDSEGSLGDW